MDIVAPLSVDEYNRRRGYTGNFHGEPWVVGVHGHPRGALWKSIEFQWNSMALTHNVRHGFSQQTSHQSLKTETLEKEEVVEIFNSKET